MATFNGKTYDEIKQSVTEYLDNPPVIALPGGSWCYFCEKELCSSTKHDSQIVQIVCNKLMNDLSKERSQ